MRVALFVTCVGDTLFPDAAEATASILARLGHQVEFAKEQTCCGQMHVNSGQSRDGRRLAERFVDIFHGFDAVVAPSSSCVGAVRDLYPHVLGLCDPVTERVWELSEFLVDRLGVTDLGARFPHRVTYHPTCHSLRVTKVGDAPLRLLERVRDLELVDLPQAEECCGFGGTFALTNAETSAAILADKCAAIAATQAEYCTALDGSCLLQIGGGLSRQRLATRPIHLAEILASQ